MTTGNGFEVEINALQGFLNSVGYPVEQFREAVRKLPATPHFGDFTEANDLHSMYERRAFNMGHSASTLHSVMSDLIAIAGDMLKAYRDNESETAAEAAAKQGALRVQQDFDTYQQSK